MELIEILDISLSHQDNIDIKEQIDSINNTLREIANKGKFKAIIRRKHIPNVVIFYYESKGFKVRRFLGESEAMIEINWGM